MALRKRIWRCGLIAFFLGTSAFGQSWGVGASVGLVNDVKNRFRLDEFNPRDVNAWVEFRLEESVILRGMFGSLKVNGSNAGRVALLPDDSTVTLPELTDKIDYGAVGVAYEFWEGDYTSGLFGGVGGYKIRPEPVSRRFESFRDQRETAFGWHVGVDASFRVVSRLSLLGRLTFHNIRSTPDRSLLMAGAGLVYRF